MSKIIRFVEVASLIVVCAAGTTWFLRGFITTFYWGWMVCKPAA